MRTGTNAGSGNAIDDPQIAIGAIAQDAQRLLIGRAIMRGNGLCDAVELDEDRALVDATLVDLLRQSAREKAAARSLQRRSRQFGVGRDRCLIPNGPVCRNPISLGHNPLAVCQTPKHSKARSATGFGCRAPRLSRSLAEEADMGFAE
jgi:hypothetical protein